MSLEALGGGRTGLAGADGIAHGDHERPHDLAELRIGQLGPVKLARLSLNRCSVERKQSHIAPNSPRLFNFLLQAEGASTFYHNGRESELETGDFVLCDTGLPHYFLTDAHSVTALGNLRWGIQMARRAWATPDVVLNTRPLEELRPLLRRNRPRG